MMKILHITNYFQPKLGYQEYYLAKTAKKFKDTVLIVTSDRYFPFPNYSETVYKILGERKISKSFSKEKGVFTLRLPIFFEFNTQLYLIHLKKVIENFRPEVVFLHGLFNFHFPLLCILKKKLKYKLIIDDHVKPQRNLSPSKRIGLFLFCQILIPFFMSYFDALVVTNPDLLAYHKIKLPIPLRNRIFFISLGADSELFYPNYRIRKKLRKKFLITDEEIVLFYSGKIIQNKGLEDMMRISKILKSYFKKKPIIFIIGNGKESYIKKLKTVSKVNSVPMIIHEMVSAKRLAELFNVANYSFWIGTIPSASKYESIMSGIPVILSDFSGRSFLAKKTGGYIFSGYNHFEVAKWIDKTFQNDKIWEKLSKHVRNKAVSEFTWELIYRKYRRLIFSLPSI